MKTTRRRDSGFSLVELLVVVVVLGVLSAAAVFAVRGITDRGQSNSCATDRRTVEQAEDTHYALNGTYVAEPDLVNAGVLTEASTMHDVTLVVDGYSVVPVGICAATAPAPAPPSGPVATTWAGLPAQQFGNGAITILLASVGSGLPGATALWNLAIAGQVPTDLNLVFVDTATYGSAPTNTQLSGLLAPAPDLVLWFTTTSLVVDSLGDPITSADLYMLVTAFPSIPLCVISGPNDVNQCSSLPPSLVN